METSGMIRKDGYERISSSGMVFNAKPAAKGNSKNSQVNGILIRLIEEEMEFSIRSQNCLNGVGIKLIGQLVQKSASELLDLRNFGRKSLREIEKILTEMGLTLEMTLDFPPWNGEGHGDELIRISTSIASYPGGYEV
jgi:DNA-directed RNA polymerase alpha subunit